VGGEESTQADNSLCYAGLLLAGANNAIRGRKMSSGVENGVLTAREIAKLDFRGLDLAVLSACQTGLGELKEDGVFGLQRGFKKAGARTLLMSLWSVSDGATQLMMTQFYSALVSGQTRRQAFHTAQEAVRNTPEYSSPVFWASFVMLDD
jgi:CHAT domain-containing protein